MDRRFSLTLALGVVVLGGTAGCTPSFFSRQSPPPQTTESQKVAEATPSVSPQDASKAREKVLPRRQPKAASCVAAGEFFYRESMTADRTPEDQKQRRETAKRAFQQALQIDPNCFEAHRGLARLHEAENDHERAVSSFQSALRLTPKDANLWFELGVSHSRHKEWGPAIEALTRAAELKPDEKQYVNILGYTLAGAGRYEESLAYLTRVAGEAKARYYIGRVMIFNGQIDQGRQQLQLSLKLDPNDSRTRLKLAELDNGSLKPGQPIQPVEYKEPQH